MRKTWHIIAIASFSALAGAGGTLLLTRSPEGIKKTSGSDLFQSILADQEQLFDHFDSTFNDDFFKSGDPFDQMRKFRERIGKEFQSKHRSHFGPFDSWYEGKIGGGNVQEITKREDDQFIYYEIKLPGVEGASVKTNVVNGYLTVTGEMKVSNQAGNNANSFFQSSFHRTFLLPDNIDSSKLMMSNEKDKMILKFPKIVRGN